MSYFKAKMHQILPRPRWGSLVCSPRLSSWISGGLFLREGRRGRTGGKGKGGGDERGVDLLLRRGKGRRGEGENGRGGLAPKRKNQTSLMLTGVPNTRTNYATCDMCRKGRNRRILAIRAMRPKTYGGRIV